MTDNNPDDKNNKLKSASKPESKQSQIAQVQQINQTLEETKKIMEGNIDLVIERGKKIDSLQDKSSEMVKNSKKFNQDVNRYSRWLEYKKYRPWAILAGLAFGTAYALFAGFTWPLVIATAFGSGAAGFGLAWITMKVMQTLDRFKFWDAAPQSVTRKVLMCPDRESRHFTHLEALAPTYVPLRVASARDTRKDRIERRPLPEQPETKRFKA